MSKTKIEQINKGIGLHRMTKIKVIARHMDHIQLEPMFRKQVVRNLEDLGYRFVDNNPDIILFHNYKSTPTMRKSVKTGAPTIILERVAAAKIVSRNYIHLPNIIGIAKSTSFRDINLNNYPFIIDGEKGNYHSRLIFEAFKEKHIFSEQTTIISKKNLEKVELWYNFAIYKMMKRFIDTSDDFTKTRPVDISFIGTTKYGRSSRAITIHRKECVKQMKRLKKCDVDCMGSRIAGKNRYRDHMIQSKIGISPWGLGEKCYRDFEALYAGCILMKPDTSFVTDWMDSYNLGKKWYTPCEITFSDLQEKVQHVKNNWKKTLDHRLRIREQLLSYWNEELIAKHVAGVFHRCQKRITT